MEFVIIHVKVKLVIMTIMIALIKPNVLLDAMKFENVIKSVNKNVIINNVIGT